MEFSAPENRDFSKIENYFISRSIPCLRGIDDRQMNQKIPEEKLVKPLKNGKIEKVVQNSQNWGSQTLRKFC